MCVLWLNKLGWVRCASVKGEESQDVCGGGESVKRVVISEKFREPCPSILGVCHVVERTGLGSLCLSERGGVP